MQLSDEDKSVLFTIGEHLARGLVPEIDLKDMAFSLTNSKKAVAKAVAEGAEHDSGKRVTVRRLSESCVTNELPRDAVLIVLCLTGTPFDKIVTELEPAMLPFVISSHGPYRASPVQKAPSAPGQTTN
jgi:hypothetical protein